MRIYAASESTVWYQLSKSDLLNNMTDKENVWVEEAITENDLEDVFDLDSLDGSFVEDDRLYYLVTDEAEIEINGENVIPENAYKELGKDAISSYIKTGASSSIIRRITGEDIAWGKLNLEDMCKDLLDVESLQTIFDDARDLNIIE